MIDALAGHWNVDDQRFTWVKNAHEILAKAVRKPTGTSESRH